MASTTNSKSKRGPGRPAADRTPILMKIAEQGPMTASDLGISSVFAQRLVQKEGLLKRKTVLHRPQKGRPPFVLALSDKGRGRVRRAQNAAAKATA